MKINDTRIYILDDDQYFAKYHWINLKCKFPDTQYYLTEQECMQAFDNPPQILILDHRLRSNTGFHFLKELNKCGKKSTIVIYLSAQDHVHIALQAMKEGAIDYFEKKNSSLITLMHTIERLHELTNSFQRELNPNEYWNKTA